MPRGNKGQEDKGKVKFRFVEFELEGSNATLEESMRQIAAAVTRGSSQTQFVNPSKVAKQLDAPPADVDLAAEDLELAEPVEEPASSNGASSRAKKPGRPHPKPEVIDLDLKAGDVAFKEFCGQKKPANQRSRYLVIACWLKEHADISEITIDHIYTCYKFMNWTPIPDNMVQPLRVMKSTEGWFDKGEEAGSYALNHVGENKVAEMTPGS